MTKFREETEREHTRSSRLKLDPPEAEAQEGPRSVVLSKMDKAMPLIALRESGLK